VCAVVWLITIRGFGLDTGFIHYGDYNCTWLQLQRTLHTDHFWLQTLTDDDCFRCRRVTHFCCLLPPQWKHSTFPLLVAMQHNSTVTWAYPCKCLTFGCIATTGVSNFRLHSNGGIRPNTSHYICKLLYMYMYTNKEQTPWPLVRERTIPTERPQLVDEI
jgi:hypothetical protein